MNILNKRQTAKQATKQTGKNLTMTVADFHKAVQAKECTDDFDDDGDVDDDIWRLRQGYPGHGLYR